MKMWLRFLIFCILVSFVLLLVASCIYGRPAVHLFFHRCCGEDIENDQVLFENFGNNFLKERLVGGDIIEADNETLFEVADIERIIDDMREVLSINDPGVQKWVEDSVIVTEENMIRDNVSDMVTEENVIYEEGNDDVTDIIELYSAGDEVNKVFDVTERQKQESELRPTRVYEILEEVSNVTETDSDREFMNVHDSMHRRLIESRKQFF